jgi:YesN/AraC family two-component response regulator
MDFKLVNEYTKDLTVLYVEDNESLRISTKKVFDNFFRHVDVAIDGDDGLETYHEYRKEQGCYYDLVISDINMPLMDGIEMSKEILVHNSTQAIIFITAHNESSYLHDAIKMGASGFLIKPLVLDEFANMLYKVCQAISDRKMVQQYYDQIEEMAMQMHEQNSELQKKNEELEKSLRLLDTMVYKEHQVSTESVLNSNDEDRIKEQVATLVTDDLPELKELQSDIDALLISIISNDLDNEILSNNLPLIADNFSRYSNILQYYSFYHDLGNHMQEFAEFIKITHLPEDDNLQKDIFLLFESFIFVLQKWQNDLLTYGKDKLNYLDDSLISDMSMITNLWAQVEAPVEELELF